MLLVTEHNTASGPSGVWIVANEIFEIELMASICSSIHSCLLVRDVLILIVI